VPVVYKIKLQFIAEDQSRKYTDKD